MNAAQVVLEEICRLVMEAGREAAAQAAAGDQHARGRLDAYYDVADVLKEQAKLIGVEFSEAELRQFDPDELLRVAAGKKAVAG
jgi:hypothetical protein